MPGPSRQSLEKLKQFTDQQQEHSEQSILDQIQKFNEAMTEEENLRQNIDAETLAKNYERWRDAPQQERSDKEVTEVAAEIDRHFTDLEEAKNKLLTEGYLRNREYRLPEPEKKEQK